MVYYINESNNDVSLDSIFNEFNLSIMEASHEYEMSIMRVKYDFLNENGYEMPIHEAEEKKDNIFKRLIRHIRDGLANLKDKIIDKLTKFANNHPNNIIAKAIKKIKFIYKKADNDIKNASTAEEANEKAKEAGNDMNDTGNDAMNNNNNKAKEAGNDVNDTGNDAMNNNNNNDMGDNEKDKLFNYYWKMKFNTKQMNVIERSIYKDNLSKDQIDVFAKKCFDSGQMAIISTGFGLGLTKDQIAMYADPKFDLGQMLKLLRFIEDNNPTKKEVEKFIKNM